MPIAVRARQAEIGRIVGTTVLLRLDVLDVKSKEQGSRLGQPAIFTAVLRSIPNELSDRLIHQGVDSRSSTARALA